MRPPSSAGTRDRVLFHLKTRGPQTSGELARRLDLTPAAVRQHLAQLEEEGLAEAEPIRGGGVGRPAHRWRLTPAGDGRFPEGYAELALDLIDGVRGAFGREGLERLIEARSRNQAADYRDRMPSRRAPLARRLAALARIRSREGYMAEWHRERDGSLTLIENHCPVCAAAQVCQGICGGELEVFREVFGGARVERTEHMLEGARRCVYRITPA